MTLKHILVVDDEAAMRALIQTSFRIFKPDVYQVIVAEDGQAALEVLQQQAFALVITDFQMPKLNGAELIRWLQQHQAEVPVILISAYENDTIDALVTGGGLAGFIKKPFSPMALCKQADDIIQMGRPS